MLTDIQTLSQSEVLAAVARGLRAGLNVTVLADFTAGVDWSNWTDSAPEVREMLGQLEAWITEYSEGDISGAGLTVRLLSLFGETRERSRRMVFEPHDEIKLLGSFRPATVPVTALVPQQSAPPPVGQPQAERGIPYRAAVA